MDSKERGRLADALYRESFSAFAMRCALSLDPGTAFLPNWHHDAIAYRYDQVRLGRTKRLIVNLPPRSAKSIFAVAMVAFIHGHDPTKKIAVASYSGELAGKLARDYRAILTSDWYRRVFPNTQISATKNTEAEMVLTEKGFRLAWSFTGTITGRGADLIIIDDPIKAEDALSETIRNGVNETFDGTILSRLDDKQNGAILVVMQRFHEEDLSGHLLRKGGWDHLSLSAIAEAEERIPIGPGKTHVRYTGEALHPARESVDLYERMRKEVGTLRFSAQYQQRPIPLEGNLIKWSWIQTFEVAPEPQEYDKIIQSWDTAEGVGDNNAYSVCLTFLRRRNQHYLLHVLRDKLDFPALKRTVVAHAAARRANVVLVESASLGKALIQQLRAESFAPALISIQPEGSKEERMAAACPMIEAGSLHLPRDADWLDALKDELLQFPHSKYKDQTDALSQYLNWIARQAYADRPSLYGAILIEPRVGHNPATDWW